jgi:hypothetical protein
MRRYPQLEKATDVRQELGLEKSIDMGYSISKRGILTSSPSSSLLNTSRGEEKELAAVAAATARDPDVGGTNLTGN